MHRAVLVILLLLGFTAQSEALNLIKAVDKIAGIYKEHRDHNEAKAKENEKAEELDKKIGIISQHLGKSKEEAEKIINEHMANVEKDPGSLVSKEALMKMMNKNSFGSQKAGTRSIMIQPGQGFNGITNFQPSGWKITETMSGPTEKKEEATQSKEPVYTYPMGLGPVLLNQCTASNYTKTSPCYNSKLFDLQNSICHNLMDAANYIGVGFDGRGYYRSESRKNSLVQRVCANKARFMGSDIPDTMNVFGIFETNAETKSSQSVDEYMSYIRHKAGMSDQRNLFKSEANRFSDAKSFGGNLGGIGAIAGAAIGGVAGAALGGAIGDTMGFGIGSGSGKQKSTDKGTSKSAYMQDESSKALQGSSQHFFAMMYVNVILYEITLDEVKPTDLSLAALKDYMALPASYYSVGADVKYQNFLLRWGTHFIRSGKFGGQLKITKTLRSDKSMSKDQFASLAEGEFKSMFATLQSEYSQKSGGVSFLGLGSKWKSNKVDSQAQAEQKQSSEMNQQNRQSQNARASEFSQTTVEAQGGTPEIAEALVDFYTPAFKQLYHDWLVSIKDFAKPFEFQLKGIDELFNMNMDDLFPAGNQDFGCLGSGGGDVKILVEPKTKRRYYIDTQTSYFGNRTVDEKVRVYCKYSDLEQFKTDMNRRKIALERAIGVYMVEGPFPTSSFELPAGQPGCEETTLSALRASTNQSDILTFAEMKKSPFLLAFDMPQEITDITTPQAKYRMIYRGGMWFATDPKGTIMHLYDGCQLAGSVMKKPKICFKGIILTYTEENGFLHVEPQDFAISKTRIPQLPFWLSGATVARPKRLGLLRQSKENVMVSKAAVPCNVRWLNSHRLDPRRDENCIHFTAATEGDIFVVFSSIPKDHHTWYYMQISPNGVSFYQGMQLQKSDIEEGMGVLGDNNLFQSFFVCVAQKKAQVIMQYGKADPDSEVGKVYSGYTFPPRSQYSRLSFYSFGSGRKSVSLMDVRLTNMLPAVTCLNDKYHKVDGHCVLLCHSECNGCTNAHDNKACHQCKHVRVEDGTGTDRVVECLSQCPAGKFLDAKREKLCVPCLVGLFKEKEGNEQCGKCPAGAYSAEGAIKCTPCSPGKYSDKEGQGSCSDCPVGHFVAAEGAIKCSPCPAGNFTSDTGRSSCDPCAYGHYGNAPGLSKCLPCEKGTHAPSRGRTSCLKCPSGTVSTVVGSRSCYNNCPLGTFSPGKGTKCKNCEPGTFAESAGSSSCAKCPAGTYQSSSGAALCIRAPEGHYAYLGSKRPEACPPGTFSRSTGQSSQSTCKSCSPGHYSNAGASSCTQCTLGNFQPTEGARGCMSASPGHYVDLVGSPIQRKCPAGRFSNSNGGTSFDSCKLCPSGYYSPSPGSSYCEHCQFGQYSPQGSTSCLTCGPGHYMSDSTCRPCAAGQFSASTGSTSCTACPVGHYASGTGSSACTPCPIGQEALRQGSTGCTRCKAGWFTGSTGGSCTECKPGYYSSSEGSAGCSPCPAGQQASGTANTRCYGCSADQVTLSQASTRCVYCPTGTYRQSASVCNRCPDFSYTWNPTSCYARINLNSCEQDSTFGGRSCRLAMDGSLNQNADSNPMCAHTKRGGRNQYWKANFGRYYHVSKVVIWARNDHKKESTNLRVSVWNRGTKVVQCENVDSAYYSVKVISCYGESQGNAILIERDNNRDYLTLCEVQVWEWQRR